MGIDHGLGGKDSQKSKNRRAKKAKKVKAIAMKSLYSNNNKKKKGEVVFDEKSRQDYITGFHKRKQERRKYGLAMEVLKKQKAHKEMIKEQRNLYKKHLSDHNDPLLHNNSGDDEDDDSEHGKQFGKFSNGTIGSNQEIQTFEDASTLSMFGSTVSVVINNDITNDDDNNDNTVVRKTNNSNRPRELTKMERALKKAKTQMNKKPKRKESANNSKKGIAVSGKSNFQKKAQSKKLLSKALGTTLKSSRKNTRRK